MVKTVASLSGIRADATVATGSPYIAKSSESFFVAIDSFIALDRSGEPTIVREVLSEVDDLHPAGDLIRRQSLDVGLVRLARSVRQAVDGPNNVVREASVPQIGKLDDGILHDIVQDCRHLVDWVAQFHHHPQGVKDVRLILW
jgi:hypothetical protein